MLKKIVILFMMSVSLMAAISNATEGNYPRSSNRSSFSRVFYTISCFSILFTSTEATPRNRFQIHWPLDHGKLNSEIHGLLCSKEKIQRSIDNTSQWSCSVIASFPFNNEQNIPYCQISGVCETGSGDVNISGMIIPHGLYENQKEIIAFCGEEFDSACISSGNVLYVERREKSRK